MLATTIYDYVPGARMRKVYGIYPPGLLFHSLQVRLRQHQVRARVRERGQAHGELQQLLQHLKTYKQDTLDGCLALQRVVEPLGNQLLELIAWRLASG